MPSEVLPYLHPESQHEINDDGRPESKEGGVNKIKTDAAGREMKLFSQPGTNSEDLILQEIAK